MPEKGVKQKDKETLESILGMSLHTASPIILGFIIHLIPLFTSDYRWLQAWSGELERQDQNSFFNEFLYFIQVLTNKCAKSTRHPCSAHNHLLSPEASPMKQPGTWQCQGVIEPYCKYRYCPKRSIYQLVFQCIFTHSSIIMWGKTQHFSCKMFCIECYNLESYNWS